MVRVFGGPNCPFPKTIGFTPLDYFTPQCLEDKKNVKYFLRLHNEMNRAKAAKIEEFRKENSSCIYDVAAKSVGSLLGVSGGVFLVQSVFKKVLPYTPDKIIIVSLISGALVSTYISTTQTRKCMEVFQRRVAQYEAAINSGKQT